MNRNRFYWGYLLLTIAVLCGLLSLPLGTRPAVGLTPNEVEELATQISVKIMSPKIRNPAENELRGTGVIIPSTNSNTYYVLTAKHVASATKGTKYWVVTSDTNWHEVTEVTDLLNMDLSWLKFTSPVNYPSANLGDSQPLKKDDTIYLYGWLQSNDGRAYRFTPGTFGRHMEPEDIKGTTDGYGITYDAVVENGMSGGPVLDGEGRLVGIHGRNAKLYKLGIPINTFLDNSSSRLSWLRICNNYSLASHISMAFVRYAGSNRGWESSGWYGINQDSCRTLPLGEGYVNNVYYYAEAAGGGRWGRGQLFCINKSEAFTIFNSDRDSCNGKNLTRVQMAENRAASGMLRINLPP